MCFFLYIVNSGTNIIEVAKLLKAYKYTGTSFSDAITPTALAQTKSKLRSSHTNASRGKQKAALENVSYPDDGKEDQVKCRYSLFVLCLNSHISFRSVAIG